MFLLPQLMYVLPRIQPNSNLLQLSVTDGETITCHLKERERIQKKRGETRERHDLLNCLREPTIAFIICSEHFYISLALANPIGTPTETWHSTFSFWDAKDLNVWIYHLVIFETGKCYFFQNENERFSSVIYFFRQQSKPNCVSVIMCSEFKNKWNVF